MIYSVNSQNKLNRNLTDFFMSNSFQIPSSTNPAAYLSTWLAKVKTKPSSIDEALDMLCGTAHAFRYDDFVTSAPPRAFPVPPVTEMPIEWTVTRDIVRDSLGTFVSNMIDRGWDAKNDVWFCRKVKMAIPEHEFETALHPQLVGFALPRFLVDHFVQEHHKSVETLANKQSMASLKAEIDAAIPDYGFDTVQCARDVGYRDGLESMALAMQAAGVDQAVIAQTIRTSLDAFANNADDEQQPSSGQPRG